MTAIPGRAFSRRSECDWENPRLQFPFCVVASEKNPTPTRHPRIFYVIKKITLNAEYFLLPSITIRPQERLLNTTLTTLPMKTEKSKKRMGPRLWTNGVVKRHCHKALSNGIVKWRCRTALLNGIVKQHCQMTLSKALPTALSNGVVK